MKTYKKLILAGMIGLASMCITAFAGDMMSHDGVMMKDGKMMVMKSGSTTAMNDTMTMSDGTKVMTDGGVMMSDGTKMMMKDGDCISMDGKMMKAGMMSGDLTENSVMMKDGKMMVMKSGKWKKMWMERTMSDGTKVNSDGEITMK